MYAVLVTVDGAQGTEAPALQSELVPRVKEAGGRSGTWFYRGDGVGSALMTFDDEEAARSFGSRLTVGQPTMNGVAGSPIVRTVEVCQVVASF